VRSGYGMMGILGMIFGVEIDWLINTPHHGKCLVNAIAGRDKYDLCYAMIRGMDSAQRDEFFKLLREAAKVATFLNEKHPTIDVR
jgi:phosphatidylserine/phosphatidylglycerophosphate/cardiolipin synthase-like enzyme